MADATSNSAQQIRSRGKTTYKKEQCHQSQTKFTMAKQKKNHPTRRLSTKFINHANQQAWLQLFKPPNLPPKLQRITIDQRSRNLTSHLSTKSINHANHQAWTLLSQPLNTTSSPWSPIYPSKQTFHPSTIIILPRFLLVFVLNI